MLGRVERTEGAKRKKKRFFFFFLQRTRAGSFVACAFFLSDNKASWGIGLSRQGVCVRWGGRAERGGLCVGEEVERRGKEVRETSGGFPFPYSPSSSSFTSRAPWSAARGRKRPARRRGRRQSLPSLSLRRETTSRRCRRRRRCRAFLRRRKGGRGERGEETAAETEEALGPATLTPRRSTATTTTSRLCRVRGLLRGEWWWGEWLEGASGASSGTVIARERKSEGEAEKSE